MTRDQFRDLFLGALDAAAKMAEKRVTRAVPRNFKIELHSPTSEGRLMSVNQALDQLYLGDDRCYRIIDIAIRRLLPKASVAFVRVSGHAPVTLAEPCDPSNWSPFRHLVAEEIDDQALDLPSEADTSAILSRIYYATDLRAQLDDIRDFLDLSERTVEWQYRVELQSIRRHHPSAVAELGYRDGMLLREQQEEEAEHRFKFALPTRVRYAALIFLVTAVDWYAVKLKEWANFRVTSSKPNGILKEFCKLLEIDCSEVLQHFSRLRDIRDAIAHGAGIRRRTYRAGDHDLAEAVKALKGFRLEDSPFLGECIVIERGALDAHIDALEKLLLQLVQTGDERNLLKD